MNTEIMIAMLTQAANYISLVGSYLMQTAAQMVSQGKLNQTESALADSYNVFGNQITTIAAAIYCILGEIAISQAIAQANTTNTNDDESQAGEEDPGPEEVDTTVNSARVWQIKRIKKLHRRHWRVLSTSR